MNQKRFVPIKDNTSQYTQDYPSELIRRYGQWHKISSYVLITIRWPFEWRSFESNATQMDWEIQVQFRFDFHWSLFALAHTHAWSNVRVRSVDHRMVNQTFWTHSSTKMLPKWSQNVWGIGRFKFYLKEFRLFVTKVERQHITRATKMDHEKECVCGICVRTKEGEEKERNLLLNLEERDEEQSGPEERNERKIR